jgi:hypothetical protein
VSAGGGGAPDARGQVKPRQSLVIKEGPSLVFVKFKLGTIGVLTRGLGLPVGQKDVWGI